MQILWSSVTKIKPFVFISEPFPLLEEHPDGDDSLFIKLLQMKILLKDGVWVDHKKIENFSYFSAFECGKQRLLNYICMFN